MKLSVPYYSQFVDIQDPFWMLRACGGVCLKMVLEYQLGESKKVPDILSICNEAKDNGGYDMVNGWVHDYLVNKAQEFDLQAHRSEGLTHITDEIFASLDKGNPVIVSVEKRVLEQTRFHLIVIVGYENDAEETGTNAVDRGNDSVDMFKIKPSAYFYYHEPESTDKSRGAYRTCDIETFTNYWRGKAIFISKK